MNRIAVLAVAALVVGGGVAAWHYRAPSGDVLKVDLAHQHLRAKMVASWTSTSNTDRITTELTSTEFGLTTRPGCGLEDGLWSKCRSITPNKASVVAEPPCAEPYQNRCFAGLGTIVIETAPGFVDDPKAQERPSRTLYWASHYCCSYEAPWVMLAPDGTAKATFESDFVPLYGTYIVTWYAYHTEWKKSAWGETYTWGGMGDPLVHKIRTVPKGD